MCTLADCSLELAVDWNHDNRLIAKHAVPDGERWHVHIEIHTMQASNDNAAICKHTSTVAMRAWGSGSPDRMLLVCTSVSMRSSA